MYSPKGQSVVQVVQRSLNAPPSSRGAPGSLHDKAHKAFSNAVQQPKSLETHGNAIIAAIITAPSIQTAMAHNGKPLLTAARA